MSGAGLPVLMYHSVSSNASDRFRPFTLDPGLLRDHLGALDSAGYRPASLADGRGERPPRREVVLTFDDAFADFLHTALPILAENRWHATLYVPTAYVGGTSRWLSLEGESDRPVMSWSALAEAAGAGTVIGSHSHTHRQLDLLRSRSELQAEVAGSRTMLEDRLQLAVTTFAYPFGYHSARVRAAVRRAGYSTACAVDDTTCSGRDELAVERLTITRGTTADQLLRRLSGPEAGRNRLRASGRVAASRVLRVAHLRRRAVGAETGVPLTDSPP